MNRKMSKRQKDIKSKLMAAIAMLLVSSIMMVSTTYAWFTLSTAPEVTGINTAVGANGNLEMALMPTNGISVGAAEDYGITSDVGDSMDVSGKDIKVANNTWGNLVKLDEGYGLDKISLYPSQLNEANNVVDSEFVLKTPTYGADGRINELKGNTLTGIYADGSFLPNASQYGVRAVGTSSGLTEREQSYRTARAAMITGAGNVRTKAVQSLVANGGALANVVIKYANSGAGVTFTRTELAAVGTLINDLEAIMAELDTAYMNTIMALIASGKNDQGDAYVKAAQILFDNSTDLDDFIANLKNPDGEGEAENADTVDNLLSTARLITDAGDGYIDMYKEIVADIEDAKTEYAKITDEGNSWTTVVNILQYVANPDNMLVNGNPKDAVDKDEIAGSVISGEPVVITILPGGGAFADLADHCDDYTAKVPLKGVEVSGIDLSKMSANMVTNAAYDGGSNNRAHYYLNTIHGALTNPPAAETGAMPINDFYGYIVDLGFKTNAAESKLMLQVEAADRIYDDNTNESTQGSGSNMVFNSAAGDFDNDDIVALMDSIKIVFYKTDTREIVARGYLDTDKAAITAEGVKANIRIANASTAPHFGETTTVEGVATTTYYYGSQSVENGVETTIYTDATGAKLFKVVVTPGEGEATATTTYYDYVAAEGDTPESWVAGTNALLSERVVWTPYASGDEIMALPQNTAVALSALVYLDGTTVTNADVAYSAETSMTGKMNLQFASSANLAAMEYTDLHTVGSKSYDVTTTTGSALQIEGNAKAYEGSAYEFTLKEAVEGTTYTVTYTVGDDTTAKTATATDGKYTIPAEDITGAIKITVTANP